MASQRLESPVVGVHQEPYRLMSAAKVVTTLALMAPRGAIACTTAGRSVRLQADRDLRPSDQGSPAFDQWTTDARYIAMCGRALRTRLELRLETDHEVVEFRNVAGQDDLIER